MSLSRRNISPVKVAALTGKRVRRLLTKLESDIQARHETSVQRESSAPQGETSGGYDGAWGPSASLAGVGLRASELYPGFKLIAKNWNYDALILLDQVTEEQCDPHMLSSDAEVLEVEGLRDLLDLLACTPWVITNSVLAGSVSLGFGNHVSFGWLNGVDEKAIFQFIFGPGSGASCNVLDISKSIAEVSTVPVPPVNEVTMAVLQESNVSVKGNLGKRPEQRMSWGELLKHAPLSADGIYLLAEERLRRFRLLDDHPLLPLVDQVLKQGQEALAKASETLRSGKKIELSSLTLVGSQILVGLTVKWDEPLDPPVSVLVSLEGEEYSRVPFLGLKPLQTIFDFDVILPGCLAKNMEKLAFEVLTENGSVHTLSVDLSLV